MLYRGGLNVGSTVRYYTTTTPSSLHVLALLAVFYEKYLQRLHEMASNVQKCLETLLFISTFNGPLSKIKWHLAVVAD